jgi:soluble lytic murein transglycosylase
VNEWLAARGDPRTGSIDVVDWIEEIPFSETRNYVKKVVANYVVYLAKKTVQSAEAGK